MDSHQLRLLDLPLELLESIVVLLYTDCNETAAGVTDLSLTCKAFHHIVMPILFHTKRLAISLDLDSVRRVLTSTDQQWPSYVDTLTLTGEAEFTVLASDHVIQRYFLLNQFFERLSGLRTLRLEAWHMGPLPGLNSLRERKLHIILNLQNLDVGFDVQEWEALVTLPNWRWSICAPRLQRHMVHAQERRPLQLLALRRVVSEKSELSPKDSWLCAAEHSPVLEELHLRGEQIEIAAAGEPAINPHVKKILQKLPSIKRLQIEGSALAWHLLPEVSMLNNLKRLTIYSGWKKAFHRACNEQTPKPTNDLPWLHLPKLKYLDIRFICRHFSIQQIVPPGLLGLRIEFFGPDDFLSVSDLNWLRSACPDLDRLELDIGNFISNSSTKSLIPQETAERLDCLRSLNHLRVVRFFPTYWHEGKMLPHPLPTKSWPILLFRQLQVSLSSLRQLYISISYGEYPFDIVPLMEEDLRPMKFRVSKISEQDHSLLYSHAYSAEATEMTLPSDIEFSVKSRLMNVRYDDFFSDLDGGWIMPYNDFVGSGQHVHDDDN